MKGRQFYWSPGFLPAVLSITLPIALQNVISLGVNLMDTVMLGQLNWQSRRPTWAGSHLPF